MKLFLCDPLCQLGRSFENLSRSCGQTSQAKPAPEIGAKCSCVTAQAQAKSGHRKSMYAEGSIALMLCAAVRVLDRSKSKHLCEKALKHATPCQQFQHRRNTSEMNDLLTFQFLEHCSYNFLLHPIATSRWVPARPRPTKCQPVPCHY